jgi:uncharacterized protein (TIGR00299 family) protein
VQKLKAVYFDCFAGASGDMIVGALIDLGLDFDILKGQIGSLGLEGYDLDTTRVLRCGIAATKFQVNLGQSRQPARRLADITGLIERSSLSSLVKTRSIRVFQRLGAAEARVHGVDIGDIHFHEVGAVDSIIDIVGAMIGLEQLGIEACYASPVRLGSGTVQAEHGILPVPAPGTAELLRGIPVYAGEIPGEFVTPTGAAIISQMCTFGPMPQLTVESVGYGAGSRDPHGLPNVLRAMTGTVNAHSGSANARSHSASEPGHGERAIVIETNIDDMNPQAYGFIYQRAFVLGALDVFATPVHMKKDRPGTLLTVLSEPERAGALVDMLLAETTTLGVRQYEVSRRVLSRSIQAVDTEYGSVRIKVAREGRRTLHFQPEYEDCARIASQAGVPLLEVQAAASAAYRSAYGTRTAAGGEPECPTNESKESQTK